MNGITRAMISTKGIAVSTTALAACLLLSTSSVAQGPGWTANGKVIRIVNTANGGFNVRLSPDMTGCVSQSNYGPNFASIPPTHPGIDRIKADLLAAYVTGETVSLYLVDSNCYVGETMLGGW